MEDGGVKQGGGCLRLFGVTLVILLAIALMLGAGFWFLGDTIKRQFQGATPETVAQASLAGLREQNRLSAFAAKFVAVVTSKQSQLGFTAQKTMIMPGSVRYEVDLSKLRQEDVVWDASAKQLTVNLPQVEATDPAVDLNNIRQYDNGGILLSVTDIGGKLDEANRKAGQQELLRQAQSAPYMRMARDATRKAIESSFAMPLRAAGIDANVRVIFPDEANRPTERWDESRRPEDVVTNKW
ncbi:DUF4230 domain-containing protein [Sphingomonas sp. HITSZ_GF]|uniref:DUF4230 domain-containing protein n=1 Tax=Sphingomonas sp. HITSZ_GF TaxID=3037247 RepID=UPI00240E472C|nr:DUF4230 domain-containing protein [Sphingomonas sp. HITSZ_GF]MDG2534834.1 DUF4230 domain-containing protein [Sphingomonas sp. HITSZ_GF]